MNEQGDLLAKIEVYAKSNSDLAIGNDSSSYLEWRKFKVNINESKYLKFWYFSGECQQFAAKNSVFLAAEAPQAHIDGLITQPVGEIFKNPYVLFEFCIGDGGS